MHYRVVIMQISKITLETNKWQSFKGLQMWIFSFIANTFL